MDYNIVLVPDVVLGLVDANFQVVLPAGIIHCLDLPNFAVDPLTTPLLRRLHPEDVAMLQAHDEVD